MLRTAQSLPHQGLSTLGFDPTRFQTRPPACYRASWQLPGPDSHRQATTSLRPKIDYTSPPPGLLDARKTEANEKRKFDVVEPLAVHLRDEPQRPVPAGRPLQTRCRLVLCRCGRASGRCSHRARPHCHPAAAHTATGPGGRLHHIDNRTTGSLKAPRYCCLRQVERRR
jgi:hypothetical protein